MTIISALFRIPAWMAVLGAVLAAFIPDTVCQAGSVRVAVAANFREAALEIGAHFGRVTGDRAILSFGATGQLYAQIIQGAPFEVFLAADQARPVRAVEEGLAVQGSRFTYARGRIALYSSDTALVRGPDTLKESGFSRIAIANPVTAPYGTAAVQVMKALDVYGALAPRVVRGANIAQAYQFVQTGNAELGFVALSQIVRHSEGSRWIVPANLYRPIAQDAVLLKNGAANDSARAFMQFLKSPDARDIAEKFGYEAGG